MVLKEITNNTNKILFFLLFFFLLAKPSFSMDVHKDNMTLIDWSILSPAKSLHFGANKNDPNDRYVFKIDNLRPDDSRIVELKFESEEMKGKFIEKYEALKKEASESLNLYEKIPVLLKKINNLKSLYLPIEGDEGLINLMNSGSGLIWTGSGISLQSGIPTLPTFYQSLGLVGVPYTHMVKGLDVDIDSNILMDFLFKVHDPDKLKIEPTPAHYAIKDIIFKTNSHYLTSNLDHLEDCLGYGETVRFDFEKKELNLLNERREALPESFVPEWILMTGLRLDDYGVAAWADSNKIPIYYVGPKEPEFINIHELYDNANSQPRSLNIQWIKADAQKYLPELVKKLESNKIKA